MNTYTTFCAKNQVFDMIKIKFDKHYLCAIIVCFVKGFIMENISDIFQYVIDNDLSFVMHDMYRFGNRIFIIVHDENGNITTVKYKNRYQYIDFTGVVARNLAVMLDAKYKENIARAILKTPVRSFNRKQNPWTNEHTILSNDLKITYKKRLLGRRVKFGKTQISSKTFGNKELSGEYSRKIIRLCEKTINNNSKKER